MRFRHLQNFILLLLCPCLLCHCSTMAKLFGKEDEPPLESKNEAQPGSPTDLSILYPESTYEWALQAYEAGNYKESFDLFLELEADGSKSPHFHKIAFYKGRILYALGRYNEATQELKKFIVNNPKSNLAQDARITLLLTYNTLRDWSKSTALAAEAAPLESYEGNKILIELLWVEALIERGELVGARKTLKEANLNFTFIPDGSFIADSLNETKTSLQQRSLCLESYLSIHECENLPLPRPSGKKKEIERLLRSWFTKRGECLKKTVQIAMPAYSVLDPRWNRFMTDTLTQGIERYFDAPNLVVEQHLSINSNTAWELGRVEMRKYFYQIIEHLQKLEPSAAIPSTSPKPYRPLVAKIEQILQKISVDASASNRTL